MLNKFSLKFTGEITSYCTSYCPIVVNLVNHLYLLSEADFKK